MGLFDGVKAMAAIVKGGIATAKACEKMDKLILQSMKEYKASLTPSETDLYGKYNEIRLKKLDLQTADSDESTTDESTTIEEELEAAQTAYLMAVGNNDKLPEAFRAEVSAALKEYEEASGIALSATRDIFMKYAETPEEKAEIEAAFAEDQKK